MVTLSARASPRVALVTGAGSGLGRALALELAGQGLHVLVTGRTRPACDALVAQITAAGRGSAEWLLADLAQLDDVRALAAAARARSARLDVLVLNAGVICARRTLTPDGHETTLAVNHLAHVLLARLLHESLSAAAEPGAPARVLVVSSSAHAAGRLDWSDPTLARGYTAMSAYARSKLAGLLFTREAARRWEAQSVMVNAVHPGGLRTGIARQLAWPFRVLVRLAFASPRSAAADLGWLATSPAVAQVTGAYFVRRQVTQPAAAARNDAAAREAWDTSADLVSLPRD